MLELCVCVFVHIYICIDTQVCSTVCPTRYRTRHFFNNFTTNEDIATTTDTFFFISHTTNVLLFKFRCNIFIGVTFIKEMPGSVVSGTPCIKEWRDNIYNNLDMCTYGSHMLDFERLA